MTGFAVALQIQAMQETMLHGLCDRRHLKFYSSDLLWTVRVIHYLYEILKCKIGPSFAKNIL